MPESDRLAGDRDLYMILRKEGFAGANYEEFMEVLVNYGIGVIGGWAKGGKLLEKCRRKGILGLSAEGEIFTETLDERHREELVNDIVAEAVINFTQEAMKGGGWSPTGAGSMKTYFIGGCLYATVEPLRRLAKERSERSRRAFYEHEVVKYYLEDDTPVETTLEAADFADEVLAKLRKQELFQQFSPTDWQIIQMKEEGLTHREIGRAIGSTASGVDSRLKRIRRDAQEWTEDVG